VAQLMLQEELLASIYNHLREVKEAQKRLDGTLQRRIQVQKEVDVAYGKLGDAKKNLQDTLDALSALIGER
jgi:uncharacterized protein YlxW (UPF0749 family)